MRKIHKHLQAVARARLPRAALSLLCLLLCGWATREAVLAGSSRLFSRYARATQRVDAADRAIGLAPSDPEAYYARGSVLSDTGRMVEAASDFQTTAALRPHEYTHWLKLGTTLEINGDESEAQAALKQAVRRAPYYAQPRWQLGNVLLRAGMLSEAFAELRKASISEPALLPAVINMAWGAFGGDAQAILQAIQPETVDSRRALAHFFAQHGKTAEAVELFRASGGLSHDDRQALLHKLFEAGRYQEAYEVWLNTSDDPQTARREGGSAVFTDGGFERRSRLNEPGFGWQAALATAGVMQAEHDDALPRTGAYSLRLEWNGGSDPSSTVVSQMLLVEPNTNYKLSFAARTEKLVTGGLPVIIVSSLGQEGQVLGQTGGFAQGTNGWRDYSLEFMTKKDTHAVLISLQRLRCSSDPCPAYGRVWVDDFFLQKL